MPDDPGLEGQHAGIRLEGQVQLTVGPASRPNHDQKVTDRRFDTPSSAGRRADSGPSTNLREDSSRPAPLLGSLGHQWTTFGH
jgi:hypothetical protein